MIFVDGHKNKRAPARKEGIFEYDADPVLRNYKFFQKRKPGFANMVDDFLDTDLCQNAYDDDNLRRAMTFIFSRLIIRNKDKINVPLNKYGDALDRVVEGSSINDRFVSDILEDMIAKDRDIYRGFSRYLVSINKEKNWHLWAAGAFIYHAVSQRFGEMRASEYDIDKTISRIFRQDNLLRESQKRKKDEMTMIRSMYFSKRDTPPPRDILPRND